MAGRNPYMFLNRAKDLLRASSINAVSGLELCCINHGNALKYDQLKEATQLKDLFSGNDQQNTCF